MSKVYSKNDSRVHLVRDLFYTECGISLDETKPCISDTVIITCSACAFISSNMSSWEGPISDGLSKNPEGRPVEDPEE